ncbi:MAG: hypothetical protein ACP5QR_17615, partial [Rhizomicrobium sp.]
MKDAAIRIRVEKDLHASFKAACQAGSRQASDVLREFMEAYIERHPSGQSELFSGPVQRPLPKSIPGPCRRP